MTRFDVSLSNDLLKLPTELVLEQYRILAYCDLKQPRNVQFRIQTWPQYKDSVYFQ